MHPWVNCETGDQAVASAWIWVAVRLKAARLKVPVHG